MLSVILANSVSYENKYCRCNNIDMLTYNISSTQTINVINVSWQQVNSHNVTTPPPHTHTHTHTNSSVNSSYKLTLVFINWWQYSEWVYCRLQLEFMAERWYSRNICVCVCVCYTCSCLHNNSDKWNICISTKKRNYNLKYFLFRKNIPGNFLFNNN